MERSALSTRGVDAPETLIENRTALGGRDLRVAVYDTRAAASRVAFRSAYPVICGMLQGKKVVHLPDAEDEPFPFLPGESLVLPPLETVLIDFPESDAVPTRCVTLEVDPDTVDALVARMNEERPRAPESGVWDADAIRYLRIANTAGIEAALRSVVALFDEDAPHRDLILDLNASEWVVRLLQAEARLTLLTDPAKHAPEHGLAAAVQYALNHLRASPTVSDLADVACMSESSFYRYFRNEFGMTPLQFLTQARMDRAQRLLRDPDRTVTDVSAAVGFRSVSHFIQAFKDHVGPTPKQYQLRHTSES